MQHGRYENPSNPVAKVKKSAHSRKWNKLFLVTLSLVLLLGVVGGSTLAYLATSSQQVSNSFTPGRVACSESGGYITNTGNVDAYIRAAVVVNWVNGAGEICGLAPSYTVDANTGWTKGDDGYFYYNSRVASGGATGIPYSAISVNGSEPEGFNQVVQVIAEAIQADGMGASGAQDAWVKAKS